MFVSTRKNDFGRLARCLGDAAIGLVLGGGGARGLAHIGVVRALREAGVPIDMIGGTSMGAVMASLVAMDQDWDQMLETNREAWLRRKPHKEYSLPFISLIRSRRLDSMAQKIWGEIEIEDLWISFFCISCNLSTSAMVIHERGLAVEGNSRQCLASRSVRAGPERRQYPGGWRPGQ